MRLAKATTKKREAAKEGALTFPGDFPGRLPLAPNTRITMVLDDFHLPHHRSDVVGDVAFDLWPAYMENISERT